MIKSFFFLCVLSNNQPDIRRARERSSCIHRSAGYHGVISFSLFFASLYYRRTNAAGLSNRSGERLVNRGVGFFAWGDGKVCRFRALGEKSGLNILNRG